MLPAGVRCRGSIGSLETVEDEVWRSRGLEALHFRVVRTVPRDSFVLVVGQRTCLLQLHIAWSSSSENVHLHRYVALPKLSCLIGSLLTAASGGSMPGSAE